MTHKLKDTRELWRKRVKRDRSPGGEWRRAVLASIRGVEAVHDDGSEIARRWILGVQQHYRERLYYLLTHPPPRCAAEAATLLRKLAKVYHLVKS